jgi:hypothetical protein
MIQKHFVLVSSLSAQDHAAVFADMMKANGFAAGTFALDAESPRRL